MRYFIIFLPLFLFASNLKELIELSLKNEQYQIKIMQNMQSSFEIQSLTSSYMPNLNLDIGYVGLNKDRLIIDPQESFYTKLSLNFLLYDGGKREALINSLKFKKNITELNKEQSKNYLALKASTLYFNYQSLQAIIKASEQKELFLENTLQRLKKFYKVGLSAQNELESINAKYHLAKLELSKNLLKLEEIKKDIKILTAQDFTPEKLNFLENPSKYFKNNNNLEFLIAKEQINQANEKLKIAKSSYFPKIFLQNNFIFYKNNYNPKIPSIYQNLANDFFKEHAQSNQFIIGMQWKIFDFNQRSKEVEKERLEVQIANAKANLIKRENEQNLEYLQKNLDILKEQINALTYALKASEIAFKVVNEKYSAGLCSYIEYLEALEEKFKAFSNLELAKNELEITKANYYFLAGIDIKDKVL
ncbi:TolC family protein [Campylobacter sp. 2018MI35]|uniref:TolC family protein n=1 Tax=Campylobacter sp. 2018MI34 TaxID=2800582 RepID=UPI001905F78A|nr:TolC family protein [Campylobacter sp. 2018MI34]MBK1991352.1 TolC family protein [Campylobacter sp. 2018MI34]